MSDSKSMPKLPAPPQATIQLKIPTPDTIREVIRQQFGPAADLVSEDEKMRFRAYEDVGADGRSNGWAIGVGRNLTTRGISMTEALLMFYNDMVTAVAGLQRDVPEYDAQSNVRKAVLVNMAHTLSSGGLAGFKDLRRALVSEDYQRAALEMGNSLWYEQQPRERSARLIVMMVSNRMPNNFDDKEHKLFAHVLESHRNNFLAAVQTDYLPSGALPCVTVSLFTDCAELPMPLSPSAKAEALPPEKEDLGIAQAIWQRGKRWT